MKSDKVAYFIFVALAIFAVVAFSTRWNEIVGPWHSRYMPVPVPELLNCFEQLKIKDFVPRGELRDEFVAYQRLVVAAWPIEVSGASKNVAFWLREMDKVCPSAQVLCQGKEAAVAHCSH